MSSTSFPGARRVIFGAFGKQKEDSIEVEGLAGGATAGDLPLPPPHRLFPDPPADAAAFRGGAGSACGGPSCRACAGDVPRQQQHPLYIFIPFEQS